MVDGILSEKIKAQGDPLWKRSGAKTREEYTIWSWSICGMACLKMILIDKYKKNYALVELGKKCLEYGGYKDNSSKYDTAQLLEEGKSIPSSYLDGLFYESFLRFIKKEFGLNGKIIRPMIIGDIIKSLSNQDYVIASVNSSIRNPKLKPKFKGGHLVLVTGYDLNQRLLYIHNPSGFYNKPQEHFPIGFEDFEKFFAYRGVVIY